MKHVYNKNIWVSINGREHFQSTYHWDLHYGEVPENKKVVITDWEDVQDMIHLLRVPNAKVKKSLFFKEKLVILDTRYCENAVVCKPFFKSLEIIIEYKHENSMNINGLKTNLSARDFRDFISESSKEKILETLLTK